MHELTQRVKGFDYRAAGAAAYLGLGAVWALGLSSSAALLMTTKTPIPPALFAISGVIPLTQTLFLWQSIVTAAVLIAVSVPSPISLRIGGKRPHRRGLRPQVRAH